MTLNFPNQSRSLDEEKERVRFWGHDGPMEISFFVEVCAIRKIFPELGGVEFEPSGCFRCRQKSHPRRRYKSLRARTPGLRRVRSYSR